jgi:hypothetical protein
MEEALPPKTVYKPPTCSRLLEYTTSPRMKYRAREAAEKAGLSHCPNIKMLVNDVAFLTEHARAGDTALYIGGTIGGYLPVVVSMFPTVQFLVYDCHPESLHYKNACEEHPPNLHLRPTWFSNEEAMKFVSMPCYNPSRTLLMVDSRNIVRYVLILHCSKMRSFMF